MRGLPGALVIVLLVVPSLAGATPESSLEKCQRTAQRESLKFAQRTVAAVSACLQKVAKELIVKGAATADDAARSCTTTFGRIQNADPTRTLEAKARAKIAARCDPAAVPTLEHTAADVLGTGAGVATPLNADQRGAWCAWFGGDGEINDVGEWIDCLMSAHTCEAYAAVSVAFPRANEWLGLAATAMGNLTPPPADALAALMSVDAAIDGSVSDDTPEIRCGASLFPATGQMTAYTIQSGGMSNIAVDDDGTVRVGSGLRFADNGDGTITDLNTRLVWEKKVAGDGVANAADLHDADNAYVWSDDFGLMVETAWDWLADLNAAGGTGFAGHDDWRLPNTKELLSIVDYEQGAPAVGVDWDSPGCSACTLVTDPSCSCTASSDYWTSTTRVANPAQAWAVGFQNGDIVQRSKTSSNRVRAVRGGL
jgi:hypothetical protein